MELMSGFRRGGAEKFDTRAHPERGSRLGESLGRSSGRPAGTPALQDAMVRAMARRGRRASETRPVVALRTARQVPRGQPTAARDDTTERVVARKTGVYPLCMRRALWVVAILIVACLLYPATVLGLFFLTSDHNADFNTADTIIVLGTPTLPDGSPSPEQRERVLEGVREFKKGVSSHMIMTGGPAHNHFVEAHTMSLFAQANGVPASAIVEEGQAQNTVQNIYYSEQIMLANGWHSTEVISSTYHLPRTALILRHHPQLQWRTHPADWPPEYGLARKLQVEWREATGCFRLRTRGFPPSKFLPN
jgi:uncharacterized SAM-binding protein YcdF (DUF218 family)